MSQSTKTRDFQELCNACRVGDIDTVEVLISSGVNVNQMDEWNYSPLILASLCGHEAVVRLLLEKGCAVCDRDTFEGQRCIYGALTDDIRNILQGFDISKGDNLSSQPFVPYISALLAKDNDTSEDVDLAERTSDLMFRFANDFNASFRTHRFILAWRCPYFRDKLVSQWFERTVVPMPVSSDAKTFQFVLNFIYLFPCFHHFERVDTRLLTTFAKKLHLDEMLEYIDELEQCALKGDSHLLLRCKNDIQTKMEDRAREDFIRLVHRICGLRLECPGDISDVDRLSLYFSDVFPDVVAYCQLENGSRVYYPVHKSMLCKSEYFATMFNSPFQETQIFRDLVDSSGRDKIVNRTMLHDSPERIPLVALTGIESAELAQIVIEFMYIDYVTIPADLAIDVLFVADLLFLDKLKTTAAITLMKLPAFQDDSPRTLQDEDISIYDILRAGWQTRVHRLETFAAKEFAAKLDRYIDTEEFLQIVMESAERIEERQETDSIELIDDIRFYLAKKYNVELDREDDFVETASSYKVVANYTKCQRDLDKIDALLFRLGLEA